MVTTSSHLAYPTLRLSLLGEALAGGKGLIRQLLEFALSGKESDVCRCFERVFEAHNERRIAFALPPIYDEFGAADALRRLAKAIAAGTLTLGEAEELAPAITTYARAVLSYHIESLPGLLVEEV
jgi:hypothetical protein